MSLYFLLLFFAGPQLQMGGAAGESAINPRLVNTWLETSLDRRGRPLDARNQDRRTILFLDANGRFEEVRGGDRYRDGQRFGGRWDASLRRGILTLQIDRRGRDRIIRYEIVYLDRDELILRNLASGIKRVFLSDRSRYDTGYDRYRGPRRPGPRNRRRANPWCY